jgi:hypothetical protein
MPTSNAGIRDNHTRRTVADFLKEMIRDGRRLSVVSTYCAIHTYDACIVEATAYPHVFLLQYGLSALQERTARWRLALLPLEGEMAQIVES